MKALCGWWEAVEGEGDARPFVCAKDGEEVERGGGLEELRGLGRTIGDAAMGLATICSSLRSGMAEMGVLCWACEFRREAGWETEVRTEGRVAGLCELRRDADGAGPLGSSGPGSK